MRNIEFKVNAGLIISVLVMVLIVLVVDTDKLNALFINYNEDFVVNEVAVLDVDYDQIISAQSVTSVSENVVANEVSSTSEVVPTFVSNTAVGDSWAWPTDQNYTITTYYSSGHKALDIYQGYGANIYAANNGVVTMVKGGCVVGDLACNGRGGDYVVINHNYNNYYTVYMHLKDINVTVGQTVSRGQVIGTMGNTGNVIPVPTSSAPYLGTHLHFCLYVGVPFGGGYAINPMNLY